MPFQTIKDKLKVLKFLYLNDQRIVNIKYPWGKGTQLIATHIVRESGLSRNKANLKNYRTKKFSPK